MWLLRFFSGGNKLAGKIMFLITLRVFFFFFVICCCGSSLVFFSFGIFRSIRFCFKSFATNNKKKIWLRTATTTTMQWEKLRDRITKTSFNLLAILWAESFVTFYVPWYEWEWEREKKKKEGETHSHTSTDNCVRTQECHPLIVHSQISCIIRLINCERINVQYSHTNNFSW